MTRERRDPITSFAFKVTLQLTNNAGDASQAFFRSVSGLRFETTAEEVKAGGVNDTTLKIVGARKFSNLILKRGFTGSGQEIYRWVQEWHSPATRQKTRIVVKVVQLDASMQNAVATWTVRGAFPVKWEIGDLDASKSELSIETLELAFDDMTVS